MYNNKFPFTFTLKFIDYIINSFFSGGEKFPDWAGNVFPNPSGQVVNTFTKPGTHFFFHKLIFCKFFQKK